MNTISTVDKLAITDKVTLTKEDETVSANKLDDITISLEDIYSSPNFNL